MFSAYKKKCPNVSQSNKTDGIMDNVKNGPIYVSTHNARSIILLIL